MQPKSAVHVDPKLTNYQHKRVSAEYDRKNSTNK